VQTDKQGSPWSSIPGLGIAVLIAGISSLLAQGHVALDPLILSMLISIIAGNLLGPYHVLEAGAALSYRIFIPVGIILYGSQLDLQPLRTIGIGHITHTFVLVFAALAAIYWLSRRLGLEKKISMLLAAGSAICGASAIVVLSPVINAEKEETSVSLLAITVMGLAGVILYPLAQEALDLSERTYALLCGSTLYQMGQVKAAAALMSHKALALAMPVKLLRISTLLPIAIIFSVLADGKAKKLFVPWFLVGSFAVAGAFNLFPPLAAYRGALAPIVGFLFSIAIAGIGLTMDLEVIIDKGAKPFLAVFLGWLVILTLFVAGLKLIG
jgi:uncharacterized integral membrane protein (TIGR00698 family)